MDQSPKVAIVIVNWNKKDYVLNLLESLEQNDYQNYEIVLVDNASEDGSVDAIRSKYPDLALIENDENLGGTGGFNTGITYIMKHMEPDYIWLLDNDAEVEKDTLSELVGAMESDPGIGIAGSRIMSPENRDLIVELGGFVDWYSGTWKPNLRYLNQNDYTGERVVEVDYVAVCSAIVRKEVVEKAGLMDERFFLHWDDVDFSMKIRECGYRVVSVFPSRVYHSVEKGFNPQILYYDCRNGLLAASKHLGGLKKFVAMMNLMRLSCKMAIFFKLENKNDWSRLIVNSITDFLGSSFGRAGLNISTLTHDSGEKEEFDYKKLEKAKKIILFADGTIGEIKKAVEKIRNMDGSGTSIDILVQEDRKNMFNDFLFDKVITFDSFKNSNIKHACLFTRLLTGNYDLGVSTSNIYNLPYVYSLKQHIVYLSGNDSFVNSQNDISKLWKVILSVLTGEVIAVLSSPILYLKSYRV